MSAAQELIARPAAATASRGAPIVIIGNGPVGMRVAEELLRRDPGIALEIFGEEAWAPYNRVRLSALVSGQSGLDDLSNALVLPEGHRVAQHCHCRVQSIDPAARTVTDVRGGTHPYSKLVLATGSRPHIPAIPGIHKAGVFAFRDLNDAQRLMARRARSRRAVVIGGGLLGLEAARGLQRSSTEVTVIEHAPWLLANQLDPGAGAQLLEAVLAKGLRVLLQDSVAEVLGEESVCGVRLRSGRELRCDTLVVATGIRPNVELALGAHLSVGTGIRVDDCLRTSDPDIYACGECAEHRGRVYGLVAPGLEQAAVAAHNILCAEARYEGSHAVTRLKVLDVSVFSIGRTGEGEPASESRKHVFAAPQRGIYRAVVVSRGRLVGAIGMGPWPEMSRIQECVPRSRRIWPWQLARFESDGRLWGEEESRSVLDWPAGAAVCNCTGVTRGTLGRALARGCDSVDALARETGASTVCGSCKPLLADLLGGAKVAPEQGHRTLVWSGAAGAALALAFVLAPPIPYPDSVQAALRWDVLWRDGLVKQVTGFTLLGLGVLVSLIALRKRVPRLSLGGYPVWRLVHAVAGVLAAGVLVAHTGLRLGANLNGALMVSFVLLLLVGATASGAIGLQHVLPSRLGKRIRTASLWLHIALLWPVPALLGFHVAKTYWF